MTLAQELVEQWQTLHLAKFGEPISYGDAEQEMKELADLVRITSPRKEAENVRPTNNQGSERGGS